MALKCLKSITTLIAHVSVCQREQIVPLAIQNGGFCAQGSVWSECTGGRTIG